LIVANSIKLLGIWTLVFCVLKKIKQVVAMFQIVIQSALAEMKDQSSLLSFFNSDDLAFGSV
jgi:hypothetical protein